MQIIHFINDRQKGLPQGQNYSIDLDLDLSELPQTVIRPLKILMNELTVTASLTKGHAESLLERFRQQLDGYDMKVTMTDHCRVSRCTRLV